MRKVVLYVAMSVDGYIADKNGSVEWLQGDNSEPEAQGTYAEFISDVDTIIMGYKTYHQIVSELSPNVWPYPNMKTYVVTHNKIDSNSDDIEFSSMLLNDLIFRLKNKSGKNIWICGGANIINQLDQQNLIDRYQIAIIPKILGRGIRLFDENSSPKIKNLNLVKSETYNGIVEVVYE